MVISTCNKSKIPWGSVVFYSYDYDYNLYFISASDSLHMKNLLENPNVALTIFDSNQPPELSEGVQIAGKLSQMVDEEKILKMKQSEWKSSIYEYYSRMFPRISIPSERGLQIPEFVQKGSLKFVRLTTLKSYLTRENKRIEVDLSQSGD